MEFKAPRADSVGVDAKIRIIGPLGVLGVTTKRVRDSTWGQGEVKTINAPGNFCHLSVYDASLEGEKVIFRGNINQKTVELKKKPGAHQTHKVRLIGLI